MSAISRYRESIQSSRPVPMRVTFTPLGRESFITADMAVSNPNDIVQFLFDSVTPSVVKVKGPASLLEFGGVSISSKEVGHSFVRSVPVRVLHLREGTDIIFMAMMKGSHDYLSPRVSVDEFISQFNEGLGGNDAA